MTNENHPADLNKDGKISPAEKVVDQMGRIDDALEARAAQGGIAGAAAAALHKIVDTLDADESADDSSQQS